MTGLGLGLASGSYVLDSDGGGGGGDRNHHHHHGHDQVPCDLALMTALESDTHSNVLSAPTLLTADNTEATIVVGRKPAVRGIGGLQCGPAGADLQQR